MAVWKQDGRDEVSTAFDQENYCLVACDAVQSGGMGFNALEVTSG